MFGGGYGQIGYDPQPYPPNDPLYLPTAEYPLGQHWIATTRVNRAWRLVGYQNGYSIQHGDPNATTAIIDTGIQTDHPEFADKLHSESHSVLIDGPSSSPNFYCGCDTSRPAFGYGVIDDLPSYGHGTKTSGLAAGLGDNAEGMAGVCWDCPIMMLRVYAQEYAPGECTAQFETFECVFNEFTIAQAIRYAAGWNPLTGQYDETVRARVISIAAEGTFYEGLCDLDNDVGAAIDEAYDRGVVIVAIAGNSDNGCASAFDCNWDGTPAGTIVNGLALHPKTITVGGVCSSGATWHCRLRINPLCDELPNGNECCDLFYETQPGQRLPVLSVCAPMDELFSTFPDYDPNDPGTGYRSLADNAKGTSWTAPQVAGIVALMLKMNPGLTPSDVRYILESTATDITISPASVAYDDHTGYGLVNAQKAVTMAMKLALPADWNGDGNVETLDAVQYLTDYSNADAMTDLNLDTTQTADDMAIFLDSYAGQ